MRQQAGAGRILVVRVHHDCCRPEAFDRAPELRYIQATVVHWDPVAASPQPFGGVGEAGPGVRLAEYDIARSAQLAKEQSACLLGSAGDEYFGWFGGKALGREALGDGGSELPHAFWLDVVQERLMAPGPGLGGQPLKLGREIDDGGWYGLEESPGLGPSVEHRRAPQLEVLGARHLGGYDLRAAALPPNYPAVGCQVAERRDHCAS